MLLQTNVAMEDHPFFSRIIPLRMESGYRTGIFFIYTYDMNIRHTTLDRTKYLHIPATLEHVGSSISM